VGLIAVIVVPCIWTFFLPLQLYRLQSHPEPLWSYEQAVERIDRLKTEYDTTSHNIICGPQLLTHGNQTPHVIVLIHNYMNCPHQFSVLAQRLFENGYNVLQVPLPRHGYREKLNHEQSWLTAEELTSYADSLCDIAAMIGKKVVVLGVSAGGVVAAWAGHMRSDVESVLLITPLFYKKGISYPSQNLATRILLTIPNYYTWIDPVLKEDGTPDHIYPRYSSRALGQLFRLSIYIQKLSKNKAPLAKKFTIITNANDTIADNDVTHHYISQLRKHGVSVTTYEFPERMQLGSDIIDPSRTYEQISDVYPQILKMVSRRQ